MLVLLDRAFDANTFLGQVAATGAVLLAWAAAWPERTWAVEDAGGTGHLLAQRLVSA